MKLKSKLNSSILVSLLTLISRFTGLLRDIATTSLQGATIYHDIFVVVLRIPTSIRTFLVEGAFSNAFIPTYSSLLEKESKHEILAFLNSILFLIITISLMLIMFAILFPNAFIFLFASGYYFDQEKLSLAISFNKIMFPYLAFIALVSFAGGIQNSHFKFGIPAATPILFNISLIASALLFGSYFKIPIYSVVWGVLAAGLLQLIIQIKPLLSLNIKLRPIFTKNLVSLKRFTSLFVPSLLIGALMQINLVVDSIFSTFLEEGSPTWLYISQRLMQLPLGVFAMAIATVLLPHLSSLFSSSNNKRFANSIRQSILIIIFISLPSMIGILVLSEEIIIAIFMRGEFSYYDVQKSTLSLSVLGIALPFLMMQRIFQPVFFSRFQPKAPLIISVISIIVNILMNYILAFKFEYGHAGIAGGFLISSIVSSVGFLMVLIYQNIIKVEYLFNRLVLVCIMNTSLMGLYAHTISINNIWSDSNLLFNLAFLFLIVSTSILLYILLSYIFGIKIKDFRELTNQ